MFVIPVPKSTCLKHLLLVLLEKAGIQKAMALDARLRTSGMTDRKDYNP